MAIFLLRSSFFRTIRPLASSNATAYDRTDGIPERHRSQWYKYVFTNSWLVRQRNRSWIKGSGKNPQKSELVHCLQCLLSRTQPWTHGLRETIACIQVKCHDGTTCLVCWQGSRQNKHKNRNARLDALRSVVPNKIACLYGLRCELANQLSL